MQKRLILIGLSGLALLLVAWWGYPHWNVSRSRKAYTAARKEFDRRAFNAGWIQLNRALELDPRNIPALDLRATLVESVYPDRALVYREQLADLEPDNVSRQTDVIACAIRSGQLALARERLGELLTRHPASLEVARVEASFALHQGDWIRARTAFEKIIGHPQATPRDRFNWAALLLSSPVPGDQQKAVLLLEEFKNDPSLRSTSIRLLLGAAIRNNDSVRAESLMAEMGALSTVDPGDRLLVLTSLYVFSRPAFEKELAGYLKLGETDVQVFVQLLGWLNNLHESRRALEYYRDRLPEKLNVPPRALLWAEALTVVEDWKAVMAFTEKAKWPGFEHQRWAFKTLAVHHLNPNEAARYEAIFWKNALREIGDDPRLLYRLAHWARASGLQDRAIDTLWEIARTTNPQQKMALQDLYRIYQSSGETTGLIRVFQQAWTANPKDYVALNNFVLLALIRKMDLVEAHKGADKLKTEQPDDSRFRMAIAYSLFQRGRSPEALAWIERHPAAAQGGGAADGLYEAAIRQGVGQFDQARLCLGRVKTDQLLPEERQLLQELSVKLTPR